MEKLDELKRKYQNIDIVTMVSVDKPERKIVEYTKNQSVDLIVMGSRGLTGISRLLLGSISKGVLGKVNCTVMIVK